MDRKIQQLSKVIFHLNAKGEDAETNLMGHASTYENEVEGILREASERVRRFNAACAHKNDTKIVEQKVREVELKFESQKRAAFREFDEFKRKATAAQAMVKQEADARVSAMQRELDLMKRDFSAKMKQFAEVMEAHEKRSGEGSRELKELRKKSSSELAEVVKKHNAKYNEMLAQRLMEEEAAKKVKSIGREVAGCRASCPAKSNLPHPPSGGRAQSRSQKLVACRLQIGVDRFKDAT